jgi:hypothetical protein
MRQPAVITGAAGCRAIAASSALIMLAAAGAAAA